MRKILIGLIAIWSIASFADLEVKHTETENGGEIYLKSYHDRKACNEQLNEIYKSIINSNQFVLVDDSHYKEEDGAKECSTTIPIGDIDESIHFSARIKYQNL